MLAEIVQAVRMWADNAGGLGVLAVAILDSSILALPNATDGLVMYLTLQHPGWWWYYAAMGTLGAVVGSWPLYVVARRGGQAFIDRRLTGARAAGAVAWYRQSAFAAIATCAAFPPAKETADDARFNSPTLSWPTRSRRSIAGFAETQMII